MTAERNWSSSCWPKRASVIWYLHRKPLRYAAYSQLQKEMVTQACCQTFFWTFKKKIIIVTDNNLTCNLDLTARCSLFWMVKLISLPVKASSLPSRNELGLSKKEKNNCTRIFTLKRTCPFYVYDTRLCGLLSHWQKLLHLNSYRQYVDFLYSIRGPSYYCKHGILQ